MKNDPAIWCLPPEGTEHGALCWLYNEWASGHRDWCAIPWLGHDMWGGPFPYGAGRLARMGWQFHSIATHPISEPPR